MTDKMKLNAVAKMNLAELDNRRKEFETTLRDFKKEMTERSKGIFADYAKAYFDAFPEVNAFFWTQYTPYFNDGDTCEFGVHDVYVRYGFDEKEEKGRTSPDDESGFWDDDLPEKIAELDWEKQNEILDPVKKPLSKLLSSLGDEAMEGLFGDHVSVYVNRYGVFVEEFDHD